MGAADVAAHIKRALSMYRLYGYEHALAKSAETGLLEKLTESLVQEPRLALTFDMSGLKHGTKRVLEEEKKEESVTRALFSDGVDAIVFSASCPLDQVIALLHTWFEALITGADGEHTFTTRIWEHELTAIEVLVRPGLAEHGATDSEAAARKDRVAQMISELSDDRSLAPAPRTKLVDEAALSVLHEVEAFRDLDRAELERRARAERAPLSELGKSDAAQLVSGLTANDRGVGQRTIFALWRAFPLASPLERAELHEFVRKIVATLVLEKRTTEVCKGLARIAESNASPKQRREVGEFLECLKSDALIAALVKLLEDPEAQQDALTLLALLPAEHTSMLIPALTDSPQDVRTKIAGVIVSKAPPPEQVAAWVIEHGEAAAASMLPIAEKIGADHVDLAIRACLVHTDQAVRMKGATAVRTDRVPMFRTLLLALVSDGNQQIRHLVLQALIRARDPIAAEMLAKQLAEASCPHEVAKTCISGLATLGGARAGEALRRVLQHGSDKELRRAAALGLSNAADAATIALLEEESQRLLTDRAIKDACKEALRRIRSR